MDNGDIIKLKEEVKELKSTMRKMIQSVCDVMNPSYSQELRKTAMMELYSLQETLYAHEYTDGNSLSEKFK